MNIISELIAAQSQQTIVAFGLAVFFSVIFVVLSGIIKNANPLEKPSTLMLLLEMGYTSIENMYNSVFNGRLMGFMPYTGFIMFYILVMNFVPLFLPVEPATTDYSVTLTLALITIVISQVVLFKTHGIKGYFKHYIDPFPLLLPINILEVFSRIVSMSLRLFCNILSGMMVMGIVSMGAGALQNMVIKVGTMSPDGVPDLNIVNAILAVPLHIFFDIFCGSIQGLVFMLLTMIFVSLSLPHEDEHEEQEEPAVGRLVSDGTK